MTDDRDERDERRWERDLRYHHLTKHMHVTHGEEVPPGTPNRRHLTEVLHDGLHRRGFAAHDVDDLK